MAKKPTRKVNKSAEIRAYLEANPNVKLADAAAALSKRGIKVNAQYISVVKSAAKKKQASAKSASAKKSVRSRVAGKSAADVSMDSVLKAKKLAKEVGGIEEAKRALEALSILIE